MRPRGWLILIALAGCRLPDPTPPAAEFLVADGSSTYWVTSNRSGIHARVSPLILARAGDHYYEVFVGESTRSYEDAIFSAEPIWRRDLVTGDTTLLWQDPKITAWENVYLAKNPNAHLVDPDDSDDDAVALSATGESDIIGVVGKYLLYTHRSMIQNPDMERADTARGIIDVGRVKTVEMSVITHDTAAFSGGGTRTDGVTRWQHNGYEVIARFDTARAQSEMMLKDKRRHIWKLGFVNSAVPRIIWLDEPRVDSKIRTALAHAFEGAISDDDLSQLAARRLHRNIPPRTHSQ
jgi:hypothetical protein